MSQWRATKLWLRMGFTRLGGGLCPTGSALSVCTCLFVAFPTSTIFALLTGYSCQEVDTELWQCVSTRACVDYELTGGGKFLDD